MDPPSPPKHSSRDGLPLSQLSPGRVNGRIAKMDDLTKASPATSSSPSRRRDGTSFFTPGIPQSPSLPEVTMFKDHMRMNADVSGLVKRFEHLDVRDREAESLERRRKHEEALDRAKIAREEAETALSTCREELRAQKKDYEESKARERKACRRIETLMDEMTRAKDQWSSQSTVYEKEVRRARKEAFKSSSVVLKLQEESKQSHNEARVLKSKLDMADRRAAKSEEDKFTAQYQLVTVQEELEKLRSSLRIVEEERERWKRSLHEDDVVRIASQGAIALPDQSMDDIDPVQSSTALTVSAMSPDDAIDRLSLAEVRTQMSQERRRRFAAESLAEFLQLECQFRCCSCSAQQRGLPQASIPLELKSEETIDAITQKPKRDSHQDDQQLNTSSDDAREEVSSSSNVLQSRFSKHAGIDNLILSTGTKSLQQKQSPQQLGLDRNRVAIPSQLVLNQDVPAVNTISEPNEDLSPTTPASTQLSAAEVSSWREISTTTRVAMHFTPSTRPPDPSQQQEAVDDEMDESKQQQDGRTYPFDREAALAAIAYRRGRAKSFAQNNGTPKRPVVERVVDRRDVSAPTLTN